MKTIEELGINPEDLKLEKMEEDFLLIKKSDVEKLGKKALSEVYEYLNLDYDDEENSNKELIQEIKDLKNELDDLLIDEMGIKKKQEEQEKQEKKKYYKPRIEHKIFNESFDVDTIYKILDKINFTFYMGEDGFCLRRTFLKTYELFFNELFFNEYYELESC